MKTQDSSGFLRLNGFTLLELLISMVILSMILLVTFQFFSSSLQTTSLVSNQTLLQEELRNAGNLIADEVQRSIYIFPPCGKYASTTSTATAVTDCATFGAISASTLSQANVSWSKITLFSSGTRGMKPDGTYAWNVGTDVNAPILAMIVSPRIPNKPCDAGGGNTNKGSCYEFVAYFPVKRSQVTRSSTSTNSQSKDLLNPDDSNKNQWTIMEYRRSLDENIYYTDTVFTGLSIPGVGTLNGDQLTVTGQGITTLPPMRWRDAGCDLDTIKTISGAPNPNYGRVSATQSDWICDSDGSIKLPSPTTDPSIQEGKNALPAISRGMTDPLAVARFAARMKAVQKWIEKVTPGDAKILIDGIEPTTGFSLDFPTNSVDERGALEVRLRLQGGIFRGGGPKVVFPATPLEFYATPRNIAP
jgi:prepilin-type N-terminal cleavage/methylation domain-containing protein